MNVVLLVGAGIAFGLIVGFLRWGLGGAEENEPSPPKPCIGQRWDLEGVGEVLVVGLTVKGSRILWVDYEWTCRNKVRGGTMHILHWQEYASPRR